MIIDETYSSITPFIESFYKNLKNIHVRLWISLIMCVTVFIYGHEAIINKLADNKLIEVIKNINAFKKSFFFIVLFFIFIEAQFGDGLLIFLLV